jgi:hypothetical protein
MDKLNNQEDELGFQRSKTNFNHTQNKDEIEQ